MMLAWNVVASRCEQHADNGMAMAKLRNDHKNVCRQLGSFRKLVRAEGQTSKERSIVQHSIVISNTVRTAGHAHLQPLKAELCS